jgi:hypothetical protein
VKSEKPLGKNKGEDEAHKKSHINNRHTIPPGVDEYDGSIGSHSYYYLNTLTHS